MFNREVGIFLKIFARYILGIYLTSCADPGPGPEDNHPPQAVDDMFTINRGSAQTLDVLANDIDMDGDPLSLVSIIGGEHLGVELSANMIVVHPKRLNYTGVLFIRYIVSDGKGVDEGRVSLRFTNAQ